MKTPKDAIELVRSETRLKTTAVFSDGREWVKDEILPDTGEVVWLRTFQNEIIHTTRMGAVLRTLLFDAAAGMGADGNAWYGRVDDALSNREMAVRLEAATLIMDTLPHLLGMKVAAVVRDPAVDDPTFSELGTGATWPHGLYRYQGRRVLRLLAAAFVGGLALGAVVRRRC